MPPNANLNLHEIGSTWSSPNNVGGLGGNRREATVGEFKFRSAGRHMGTVTLGIKRTSLAAGVANIGWLHARITYGAGSANHQVEIDWDNGSSITIPLSDVNAVRVDAVQYGLMDEGVALNASFMIGPRAAHSGPTHSTLLLLPPGAGPVPSQTTIPVPAFAKTLLVPKMMIAAFGAANPSDLEIRAEQYGAGTIGVWYHNSAADAAIWTTGIQLPPNAESIRLLTVLGTPVQPLPRQPVIFGIDG